MTLGQIARHLGTSMGTIERDIDALKDNFPATSLAALVAVTMRAGVIR
jgi:DeoR/GlpR family transcriptional regulator of sugar metabolism